jgi:hypothetical protein
MVPRTEKELIRVHFSLSPIVKKEYPGKESREDLTWDLAPYYNDALFATPDDPVIVEHSGHTLHLFPTRKNLKKIRVMIFTDSLE